MDGFAGNTVPCANSWVALYRRRFPDLAIHQDPDTFVLALRGQRNLVRPDRICSLAKFYPIDVPAGNFRIPHETWIRMAMRSPTRTQSPGVQEPPVRSCYAPAHALEDSWVRD